MTDLDRLIAASNVWWGYSETHGWLVRDQDDPREQGKTVVIYLSASDWSEVRMPYYGGTAFDSYTTRLKHFLDEDRRAAAEAALRHHVEEFLRRRPELRQRALAEHAEVVAAAEREAERRRLAVEARARRTDDAIPAGAWVSPVGVPTARPVAANRSSASENSSDQERTHRIRTYCAARRIDSLLHFTRCENLAGMWRDGLLARDTLVARGLEPLVNDDLRADHHLDAICLSVSFPNYRMFWKYRSPNLQIAWAVLELRANVLWELPCAFYPVNASHASVNRMAVESLRSPRALEQMFADRCGLTGQMRNACGIPDCYPTNPQAEVLVFGPIPLSYIRAAHVQTQAVRQSLSVPPAIPVEVNQRYFDPRTDWRLWQTPASSSSE